MASPCPLSGSGRGDGILLAAEEWLYWAGVLCTAKVMGIFITTEPLFYNQCVQKSETNCK